MKHLFFILLMMPLFVTAQYNEGMELWKEDDCYKHLARVLTRKNPQFTDTCKALFSSASKDLYIINRDYLKDFPDTVNGYTIHRFIDDGNYKTIAKEIKEKDANVVFIAHWTNYLEMFCYWVFPVEVKKNKLVYGTRVYKYYYFFHQDTGKFEFQKIECADWGK